MSHEHHHHNFHHNQDQANASPDTSAYGSDVYNSTVAGTEGGYGSYDYQTGPGFNGGSTVVEQTTVEYGGEDGERVEKHHKRLEHVSEFGTAAAGAYALYEKHEVKKDPEHAHRHKIEEEIAAAAAVGGGGLAFHEHHEKKEDKEEAEEAHGKKHHHLF